MKKTISKLLLGILIAVISIAALFYFFIFWNPFNIHEFNSLRWVPVLITITSIYFVGKINNGISTLMLPLQLIPLALFKPFNFLYFPFNLFLLAIGILMLIVTRENQKSIFRMLSWTGASGIFLFTLFSQPLIIEKPGFGYNAQGELINANVIWDFSQMKFRHFPVIFYTLPMVKKLILPL